MFRFNNPDALLVLLLVFVLAPIISAALSLAAWAVIPVADGWVIVGYMSVPITRGKNGLTGNMAAGHDSMKSIP